GPLVGGGALHLQQGQPAQGGVAEQPEQAAALVGHLGGEGGRRLFADDLLQVRGRVAALIGDAALAPALVAAQPAGLAGRQRNEHSPQVVTVVGATLEVSRSTFTGNVAVGSARGRGGAILNDGTAGVTDSAFTDNRAVGGNGGSPMSSSGSGGAIRNENGATLAVSDSTFAGNLALGGQTINAGGN